MRSWTQAYGAHFAEDFYGVAKRILEECPEFGYHRDTLEAVVKTYEAKRPGKAVDAKPKAVLS